MLCVAIIVPCNLKQKEKEKCSEYKNKTKMCNTKTFIEQFINLNFALQILVFSSELIGIFFKTSNMKRILLKRSRRYTYLRDIVLKTCPETFLSYLF